MRYRDGRFPSDYIPTVFEMNAKTVSTNKPFSGNVILPDLFFCYTAKKLKGQEGAKKTNKRDTTNCFFVDVATLRI